VSYYNWNFSKLPEHEYASVIEAVECGDMTLLTLIHNKYKLSNNEYCCPQSFIIKFFEDAIEKGLIK
jgi:hypothetical protein